MIKHTGWIFFPVSINRTALNKHTGQIIFQIQLSVQAHLSVHGFFHRHITLLPLPGSGQKIILFVLYELK